MRQGACHAYIKLCALILFVRIAVVHCDEEEVFTEELLVRPLPNGHLLVHFHFHQATPPLQHHCLFPRAIDQLAHAIDFEEIELHLTHGRWHYHKWGHPLLPAKPVGAELKAAFRADLPPEVLPQTWGNLTHALSGLFCASLNFLSRSEMVAHQVLQATPSGPRRSALRRLYATLPKEAVCTENLTPWLKLLPCRDQAGFATLFHRPTMYGADYHSMGVHVEVQRDAQGRPGRVQLTQTLMLVLKIASLKDSQKVVNAQGTEQRGWDLSSALRAQLRGACPLAARSMLYVQAPEPAEAVAAAAAAAGYDSQDSIAGEDKQQHHHHHQQQQRQQQHGNGQTSAFPPTVAQNPDGNNEQQQQQQQQETSSAVLPCQPAQQHSQASFSAAGYELSPAPDAVLLASPPSAAGQSAAALALYAYNIQRLGAEHRTRSVPSAHLNVRQVWQHGTAALPPPLQPQLAVHSYVTGVGNLHGGIVLQLMRTDVAQRGAAHATVADTAAPGGSSSSTPQAVCILQVVPWYLRMWLHTMRLRLDGQVVDLDALTWLRYVSPAEDRSSPLVLDMCLALPANVSVAVLDAEMSKGFLTVSECPPDAHRGFDIPAAIVSYVDTAVGGPLVWRTQPLSTAWGAARYSNSSLEDTALLEFLSQPRAQQIYSEGLLVPLSAPDFSMPYNVICLTSTVLAIYIGATLNTLLRRHKAEDDGAGKAGARATRRRVIRFLVVLTAFGGLGVYLDKGLQDKALGLLQNLTS